MKIPTFILERDDYMSEGLKPHRCQFYEYKVQHYKDKYTHCMVKKVIYRCMICGKTYADRYDYDYPRKLKHKHHTVRELNKLNKGNWY
jgi:hypothetical protein